MKQDPVDHSGSRLYPASRSGLYIWSA